MRCQDRYSITILSRLHQNNQEAAFVMRYRRRLCSPGRNKDHQACQHQIPVERMTHHKLTFLMGVPLQQAACQPSVDGQADAVDVAGPL